MSIELAAGFPKGKPRERRGHGAFSSGWWPPHFPLVAAQKFFDLYPHEVLPEVKLHPSSGYKRHPWVEKQNAFANTEAKFHSPEERLEALAAYYALCSSLDHNVGLILEGLQDAGFGEDTTIVYTSDHGDNLGARGLWGKSTLYQESVHVPLIMAGPEVEPGTCDTSVSLLDLSASIPAHFGLPFACDGASLTDIAEGKLGADRAILSQYHAVGAVSGAYMLRFGRWKLNTYVGFPSELFDLENDPEELTDLAGDPAYAAVLAELQERLKEMVDPEQANAQAFSDQDAMVARYGGREKALKLGAPAATPPPKIS